MRRCRIIARLVVSLVATAFPVAVVPVMAQECPVFGAAGAVHADGTLLVLGQFAIGDVTNGAAVLAQGAVPCWLAAGGCPGDLNSDGHVDQADLALLLSCYGAGGCGDTNGDGVTDQSDLAELLAVYGQACE